MRHRVITLSVLSFFVSGCLGTHIGNPEGGGFGCSADGDAGAPADSGWQNDAGADAGNFQDVGAGDAGADVHPMNFRHCSPPAIECGEPDSTCVATFTTRAGNPSISGRCALSGALTSGEACVPAAIRPDLDDREARCGASKICVPESGDPDEESGTCHTMCRFGGNDLEECVAGQVCQAAWFTGQGPYALAGVGICDWLRCDLALPPSDGMHPDCREGFGLCQEVSATPGFGVCVPPAGP